MAYPWILAEYYRRQRLRNPEPTVVMLVEIMGVAWWIRHGFYREYRAGRRFIDLANPVLKLAVEGDGERWHMDVVKEQQRNDELGRLGWQVVHFRYDKLKYKPELVRQELEEAWDRLRPRTFAEEALIREQMRRSGFLI